MVKSNIPFTINNQAQRFCQLGVWPANEGMHFSLVTTGKKCVLCIYLAGKEEPVVRFPFPEGNRWGDVVYLTLVGTGWEHYEYDYEVDGVRTPDPYGRCFVGRERWGEVSDALISRKSIFPNDDFDWEGDRTLKTPLEQSLIYHLHVRGFSNHVSSKVKEKGTFRGLMEKIPYLMSLGISAVELMPVTEFEEIMIPKGITGDPFGNKEPTGKVNYWGYGETYFFAPKASYGSDSGKQPDRELKELVKALHKAGIEVILEFYVEKGTPAITLLDCLRFWVIEYHIDGMHLMGSVPTAILASDPVLSDTKLFADNWDDVYKGGKRHLAEYNDGYSVEMKKYLKGDEDQLNQLIYYTSRNPADYGVINYITNTNGFTLMDLVSYDRKRNEINGEDNKDGSSFNYSWNCGAEGKSRSRKVLQLRRRQIRNAFTMLLLSQGTPLILAGDEFGNSQEGNNNAYCQDNAISWLNWTLLDKNNDIFDFVKSLIAFRKSHPIFYVGGALRGMDTQSFALPAVSYHGTSAWRPELDGDQRQLGILYCGEYAKREDRTSDDYFYVAYNMHWDSHEFALPNLPKGKKWYVAFGTDQDAICESGKEVLLIEQKTCVVPPRVIWALIGR